MEEFLDDYDLNEASAAAEAESNGNARSEHLQFEHFVTYANQNEEKIRAALEELRQKRTEADPVPLQPERASSVFTLNIDGFPKNVDEDMKTPCKLWELWEIYRDQYEENHTAFPSVVICGDIDSVYTFDQSLSRLVDACGVNSCWTMPSILRRESADTGSRFCVNSDLCENKPFLRSGTTKTVPLNWFPNVKIATIHLGDPFRCEMHVQLYFLGVEGFAANAYFSTQQLGVINAMFNFAATVLVNDVTGTDFSIRREFRRFYNLETLTGSRSWTGSRKTAQNYLSAKAMKALAEKAVDVLALIAEDSDQIPNFEDPFLNGVQPEDKRNKTLDRREMVKFAKRLQNAMCYTASLAGCKGRFTERKFERIVTEDPRHYMPERSESDTDDSNSDSTGFNEDEYCRALNRAITKARCELSTVLDESFKEAFNANEDPETVAELHSESNWYLDKGFEVALSDPKMNLFPLIRPSEEILKSQLRERQVSRAANWANGYTFVGSDHDCIVSDGHDREPIVIMCGLKSKGFCGSRWKAATVVMKKMMKPITAKRKTLP